MKILSLFWHNVLPDSAFSHYRDSREPDVSTFRKQIEFLVKNYTPISVMDFLMCAEKPNYKRSYKKQPVFLSFDDGFQNVLEYALPILEEYKVPVTFFVLGEILNNPGFVPWYIETKHLLRRTEKENIEFESIPINLNVDQDRAKLRGLVASSLRKRQSHREREELFSILAQQLEIPRPLQSDLDADLRFTTRNQLAGLGTSSVLTIGSHAMTHMPLDGLTRQEQLHELKQSDSLLREHCSSYIPVIAYPNGCFNTETISIARGIYKAGFAVFEKASTRNLYAYSRLNITQHTVDRLAYAVSPKRINYIVPMIRFLHKIGVCKLR